MCTYVQYVCLSISVYMLRLESQDTRVFRYHTLCGVLGKHWSFSVEWTGEGIILFSG